MRALSLPPPWRLLATCSAAARVLRPAMRRMGYPATSCPGARRSPKSSPACCPHSSAATASSSNHHYAARSPRLPSHCRQRAPGCPPASSTSCRAPAATSAADLTGRRELSALYVRGGERTIAQAERAHARTNVPLHVLRGGGNVLIVGPDLDLDAGTDLDACCSISADGAVAPPRRATDGEPHRARYDRGHGRPQRPRRHRPPDVLAASTDGVATWRSGLAGCPPGAGHRTAGTGTERRELDSR